jgi:cell division septum initiation protein DivIVA
MNQKEAIAKLVSLFTEEESLKEQIAEVKSEIKESGMNAVVLASVAKAIVANKVDELLEKSESTLEAIEVARG